ncbi:MAG: F0F1 ATP synthase subunit delta [Gammaproteobacteria bacterium]
MANLSKIARPYAKAIFELARQKKDFNVWSESLQFLSMIASDPVVIGVMKDPKFAREKLIELFLSIQPDILNEDSRNLIHVLGRFRRLSCLPDISSIYEIYRAQAEQVIKVTCVSAVSLESSYQQLVREKLSKRFERQVELDCRIDPTLIGGAVIRIGDQVVDGSVRGRLLSLKENLVSK